MNKETTLRESFEKEFDDQWPSVRSYTAGRLQEFVSNWWLSKRREELEDILRKIESMDKYAVHPAPIGESFWGLKSDAVIALLTTHLSDIT